MCIVPLYLLSAWPCSVFRTSLVMSDWCQSGCCGGYSKNHHCPPWTWISSNLCWKLCWTTPRTRTRASGLRVNTQSSTCYSFARGRKPCRCDYCNLHTDVICRAKHFYTLLSLHFRLLLPFWTLQAMTYCQSVTAGLWKKSPASQTPMKRSMTQS